MSWTDVLAKYNERMKAKYESLKDKQSETIEALRKGDVLAILPTGYGKSLIYHLMPFVDESCFVIVLCPLNSILYEQKERLGESALLIDRNVVSDLKAFVKSRKLDQSSPVIRQLCMTGFPYILSTPENILTPEFNILFQQPIFQDDNRNIYIVVDECHCVVQWGYDFRPKYQQIYELRCTLTKSHYLAMTATASVVMQRNICDGLHLVSPSIIAGPIDRPNIFMKVQERLSEHYYAARRMQKRTFEVWCGLFLSSCEKNLFAMEKP